jgi:hypothetical protein
MADQKKPTPPKAPAAAPKQAAPAKPLSSSTFKSPQTQPEKRVVFERENYMLFFIGIAFIVVGYLVMAGGNNPDPNSFKPEEIYAWRRINLAPTLVLLGFGIEIVAIMYRKKKAE